MSKLRENIAIRLIEERGRLGYSKASFAHQAEISAEMLRLYELGRNGISAEFLAKVAELGVDTQYVLTGIKSTNLDSVEAEKTTNSVQGNVTNSVLAGSGSTIHNITTRKYIEKVTAEVNPGEEHITEEMAMHLSEKVKEIVEWEKKTRRKPKSFQAVWSALNRHCGVTRYRLIAINDFDKASKYLNKWLGRLTSTGKAKSNSNAWRKKRYAAIHAQKNQKNLGDWYKETLIAKYGVESSKDLSDDNLERFYRSIMRKKATK